MVVSGLPEIDRLATELRKQDGGLLDLIKPVVTSRMFLNKQYQPIFSHESTTIHRHIRSLRSHCNHPFRKGQGSRPQSILFFQQALSIAQLR